MPLIGQGLPCRTPAQKASFVVLTLAAIVSVPYLIPAPFSISRSYIAGFSNRTAVFLLLLGTALFAAFTRGAVAAAETRDSRLSWRVPLLALLLTLADCLHYCKFFAMRLPGGEAEYFLNRLQMLASGLTPYRQFEFVYGPFLLYPILWTQRLLHLSSSQAYLVTWILFWQMGVIMVWVVVRGIDLPIPSRRIVFAFLVLAQLAGAAYGGLSYSPFRSYFAASCIIVTCRGWTRFRKPWILAVCSIASVGLTICCSMDQAVAVVVGLLALILLLTFSPQRELPRTTFVLIVLGTIACFACAATIGLLAPLRSFGGGGYAYPLLPSPAILLTLFTYMVSGCLFYRVLAARFLRTAAHGFEPSNRAPHPYVVVPLAMAGCAMIPAALGRCDVLHIEAATPAFVLGVVAIATLPALRRWWLPLALVFLVVVPLRISKGVDLFKLRLYGNPDPSLVSQGFTAPLSDNQWYVSPARLTANDLPCDRQYFSPSFMPVPTERFRPACLDTGYYVGFTDVITPSTIARKITELRNRPSMPLLMENTPLEAQLPRQLATMESLHYESETFWVPPVRHAPLTYASIIDYIRKHYVQGPEEANGRLRIWYPRPDQGSTTR